MASRDPSRLIGRVMDLLRDHPQGSPIWACFPGATNESLFPNSPETPVALSDVDYYLALLAGALEFAVFPHTRRLPRAESLGISTRSDAWQWVTNQIQENVNDGSRQHADSMGAIAHTHMDRFANGQLPFPP